MFSPHAWGCTDRMASGAWEKDRFPHTRGDVPKMAKAIFDFIPFSPHAWGCTAYPQSVDLRNCVFPTRVGMYLAYDPQSGRLYSFPHTRGDVPFTTLIVASGAIVFPTRVGMYRLSGPRSCEDRGFPHTRGDVPSCSTIRSALSAVFPTRVGMYRSWSVSRRLSKPVFPTRVGMYRFTMPIVARVVIGFPHTRGDVPPFRRRKGDNPAFSPHAWGCTGLPPGARP